MRLEFLREPELQFGSGTHVDIRFGLMDYGPLDFEEPKPRSISVGVIGTPETIEGLASWLERCRTEIPAKQSRQPNLFPPFPGFNADAVFRSNLVLDDRHLRQISARRFDDVTDAGWSNKTVASAVKLFEEEFEVLSEDPTVDVVLCAPPMTLLAAMEREIGESPLDDETEGPESASESPATFDFRRLLKARAMQILSAPIQIVLPTTYDAEIRRKQKRRPEDARQIQDDATRAWNLHTALYYKAGGTPWRLIREASELTTCYVGISFYRSLDEEQLMTSMAQVFNERGDGLIVRGGPVKLSKEDRVAHLSAEDARTLLADALERYRKTHRNAPARVVVHKTSGFNEEELEGFTKATSDERIDLQDFVSFRRSAARVFRNGSYPPLRGTLLHLDAQDKVLYTRGSVDFFATYPGMYVPRPLAFRCEQIEQTPSFLAREALALTKMNWNSSQFDGGQPITLQAASKVGDVLKYVGESDKVAPRYSFYM